MENIRAAELEMWLTPLGPDVEMRVSWRRANRLVVDVEHGGGYQIQFVEVDIEGAAVADSSCVKHGTDWPFGSNDCATCVQERRDRIKFLAKHGQWQVSDRAGGVEVSLTRTNGPGAVFWASAVVVHLGRAGGPCHHCGSDVFTVSALLRHSPTDDGSMVLCSEDQVGSGHVDVTCVACGTKLDVGAAQLQLFPNHIFSSIRQ